MADQALPILDAIDARLATYTATGQTLASIERYLVRYDKNELPDWFGRATRRLLVESLTIEGEIVSIPAILTRKTFPVRFQVYTEHADYPTNHIAATLIDLVEDVFHQQSLGISNLLVDPTSKTYGIPGRPEFARLTEGGAELILTYRYTDARAIP